MEAKKATVIVGLTRTCTNFANLEKIDGCEIINHVYISKDVLKRMVRRCTDVARDGSEY
jgi:hypothetical protein